MEKLKTLGVFTYGVMEQQEDTKSVVKQEKSVKSEVGGNGRLEMEPLRDKL